jgi:hypothetical protein
MKFWIFPKNLFTEDLEPLESLAVLLLSTLSGFLMPFIRAFSASPVAKKLFVRSTDAFFFHV